MDQRFKCDLTRFFLITRHMNLPVAMGATVMLPIPVIISLPLYVCHLNIANGMKFEPLK